MKLMQEMKDAFRGWLRKHLNLEERRENYYINFLQNKRKNKIVSDDQETTTFPLLQKVMLKFPDMYKASKAYDVLNGLSFGECVLSLELQEQRAR